MSSEQLYRDDLLAGLLRVSQRPNEGTTLKRAERLVAGLIHRAIDQLPVSPDVDILPYLPQLVCQALAAMRRAHDAVFQQGLQRFEQLTQFAFPNFETLEASEEACDVSLLMVETVIISATGNQFVAADVKAALRAPRYVAERHAMGFCYGSIGGQALRLATSDRVGLFGNTVLRIERREEDMVVLFSAGAECHFAFAWDGVGATLCFALGNLVEQHIMAMLADVCAHWQPEGFFST